MQPKYMSFPRTTVQPVKKGPEITIIMIPKGNPWGEVMGITTDNAYIVFKPRHDNLPPNTIFIRQETLERPDGHTRLRNAVIYTGVLAFAEKKEISLLDPAFMALENTAEKLLNMFKEDVNHG